MTYMAQNIKLELTWLGKYDAQNSIEPRILIENPAYSYGEVEAAILPNGKIWNGNMIIHGDNLLALKSLEDHYAGCVKCVYIDPPFNTGSRIDADGNEIGYDDGIEHSIWLDMMYKRLRSIYKLLRPDGALFVHLDDNEADYCKVLLDEVFGRNNFMNRITVEARSPSAFSTVNPGMFVASEYILYYAKNRKLLTEKQMKSKRQPDYAYNKYITNYDSPFEEWKFIPVSQAFQETGITASNPESLMKKYNDFIIRNADRICRYTAISDSGAGQKIVELKKQSLLEPDRILKLERINLDDVYVVNGQQLSFYSKNIREINGEKCATMPLTDIWTDIAWEGIAKEGNVTFKRGKKPERLIQRCIEMVSDEGDIVLDSFLGSGTTAAVAHKMKRKYIGIELGTHAYSHCYERLKSIVDGVDSSGVSKFENWKGGGGFKFYELAPSLLKKDSHGHLVINKEYNADMLAAAMAKMEGFTYEPSTDIFWKQGHSSETDFIYTTTQFVTVESLGAILDTMVDGESLLVCCKAFQPECKNFSSRISVKKIPSVLLGRCEFDHDDYSLNIIELPQTEEIDDSEDQDNSPETISDNTSSEPSLF